VEHEQISIGLTLEDEFTLTRIRNGAKQLKGRDRDQYLWQRIFRMVCRERAYKAVIEELGIMVDPSVDVFDDKNEENHVT
jgi:hypothetical protein|tara:strand:- start:1192 stop:1431 length:240 start_codon:yes stop_codon:yes gene_type:complete